MTRKKLKQVRSGILLGLSCLSLSACDAGFQEMGAAEYGIVFSKLPPMGVGSYRLGGLREGLLNPLEMEFVFPWEKLYRVDTSIQSITWGAVGEGDDKTIEDYVETRSLDGNEVGLAMTVQYHIDPKMVLHVVQNVSPDNSSIRRLIAAVARADIRTHMNVLKTQDFFNPRAREEGVQRVKKALSLRLNPEGIIIDDVIYRDHRFERRLASNEIDRSYQELIDQTQAINQKTEQEKKRIGVVVAQKKREFNEEKARMNRLIEEAEGEKRQASLRGDAYLQEKTNVAERITAVGLAEVEALRKQIEALSGPGGESLLRLSIAKALSSTKPRFVLLQSEGGAGGLEVRRVDTNDLIRDLGLITGLEKRSPAKATQETDKSTRQTSTKTANPSKQPTTTEASQSK